MNKSNGAVLAPLRAVGRVLSGSDDFQQSSCTTAQAARILGISVGTVQKLVERHELTAWRTPGGHRRVLLQSVDQYQRVHQVPDSGKAYGQRRSALRVVLVDDCLAHVQAMEVVQRRMGDRVQCDCASSGVGALMGLIQTVPDVLIVNTHMDDVNPQALLGALQEDPRFSGMVTVLITSGESDSVVAPGPWPDHVATLSGPLKVEWLQGLLSGLTVLRQRSVGLQTT